MNLSMDRKRHKDVENRLDVAKWEGDREGRTGVLRLADANYYT